MTFAWPHLLWLAAVPIALLLWEITRHRRAGTSAHTKILQAEARSNSLKLSAPGATALGSRNRVRPWLCVGLIFGVVAAARPQWGRLEEPVFDQAREILIAMDLSRSMLTPDVKPSRLERAKLLTQSLLEKLTGERVGLVVFSGTAFLQSPLSSDYEILREFLPALNPEFLPEGGTNYSALIDTSVGAFGSTAAADRFLIILSDGEATEDDWKSHAADLKKKGIRVIGLGVGTSSGAMIPDGSGGLVKDERGAVVLSKLESGTLRELAEMTGGVYQDASNWIDLAALINATIDAGKKGQFVDKTTIRLVERFQWPLGLAFWCLLVSLYYEFPVRPKSREIKLNQSKPTSSLPPTASAALTLLVLLSLAMLRPAPVQAAEDTGPALGRIYGRLAMQDKLSPQDYAEVGRETLRWGKRLKENGQPVIPGPVTDAIQAVDALIAIDSKIADWTKLRADLVALLDKPPEQKKDQQPKQDPPKENKDDQQKQDQKSEDQKKSDQSKQDQQKKDPSKPQDQSSPKDQQAGKDPADQKEAKDPAQKSQHSKNKESAFGKMQPPDPSSPAGSPPPSENQKVGGVAEKKPGEQAPVDPALAMPLQKLEQIRNQDSPAELFKLMEGEKDPKPRKKTKDW
jgi:Ca-activated chloride channel family protein